MKIFSRQTVFSVFLSVQRILFPAASFCRQFFLYTCVSNQWSRLVMMMMVMMMIINFLLQGSQVTVCALFSKF